MPGASSFPCAVSLAVDLAWVADGRLDMSITLGNQPWDTAAGALIAREAGAVVVDADGSPHCTRSRCLIAATPSLHHELLPLLPIIGDSPLWRGQGSTSSSTSTEETGC